MTTPPSGSSCPDRWAWMRRRLGPVRTSWVRNLPGTESVILPPAPEPGLAPCSVTASVFGA